MGEILVSICCQTYNHVAYIEEAVEGFLMQKTNFRFEILIRDDASTDGTTEIVQNYALKFPELIKLLTYEENQFKKGVRPFPDNVKRAQGKYIALCEGDDYWTDPLKLQNQVDFLEDNENYGLVFTDLDFYNQKTGKTRKSVFKNKVIPIYNSFEDHLMNTGFLAPCTWLCRKELIPSPDPSHVDGTFPWLLEVFKNSKVKYLPQNTSVYRILMESSSHSNSIQKRYNFALGVFDIQKEFLKKYELPITVETKIYRRAYNNYLPGALVLNDSNFILSAQNFWKCNPLTLKEKIFFSLTYLKFSRHLFRFLYLLKGKKIKG